MVVMETLLLQNLFFLDHLLPDLAPASFSFVQIPHHFKIMILESVSAEKPARTSLEVSPECSGSRAFVGEVQALEESWCQRMWYARQLRRPRHGRPPHA